MDVNVNTTSYLPEISGNYITSIFDKFKVSFILLLIVVVVVYIIIFSLVSSRKSNNNGSSSASNSAIFVLELFLWIVLIVVVYLNFKNLDNQNYNFRTKLNDLLNARMTQVEVHVDGSNNSCTDDKDNEVFHIPNNKYTYDEAKEMCNSFNSKLATYEQIEKAYNKGANWCSYGWSSDQLALFPTQKSIYNKLKRVKEHKNDCGRQGINGGYIDNKHVKFGVNCYGKKPEMLDPDALNRPLYPVTKTDKKIDELSQKYEKNLKTIDLSPFNHENWSRI